MATPKKATKVTKPVATIPTPAPVVEVAARSETKGSGTTKARPTAPTLSHDAISKRAYEIYASRGYAVGSPDEDWREAERQLKAGL